MKLSELARKVIDDYPGITANRRRAVILTQLYPDKFKDIEQARGVVRKVTGSAGFRDRNTIKDAEKIKYFHSTLPDIVSQPQVNNEPVIVPEERAVLWNDLHGPWFDKEAIERALRESDSDTLILNGDVADFYWVSRFHKDPKMAVRFEVELQKIRDFLFWVRDKFDNVYYKLANHEDRLPHFLSNNAKELANLPELQTESLLKFEELNIKVIGTHQHIEFDDLDIVHGHELRVMGGVNLGLSYAKAWQGFKGRMDVKIMAAHHHRFNHGVINNPDGSKAYGWVNGCLCQRSVGYAPKNNWQHGITHITKTNKGVIVEPLKF